MKILQIDKYNYLKGGAERYYLELSALLRNHGHEVIVFSQQHEHNVDTQYEQYFPPERYRFFWSKEVAHRLEELIQRERPDIAHVHLLYHHLTPSVLKVLKRHNIPVVMTVHDYKLICPNYLLFTEGSPCTRCQGHKYYQAVAHKCIKDSITKSGIVATEMYWHKVFQSYEQYIDLFITPSNFAKTILVQFGQNSKQISVIPHFVNLTGKTPSFETGKYVLYFGRLSEEKGVDKIIQVLHNNNISERVVIAGTGPLENTLKRMVEEYGLSAQVTFVGHLEGEALARVIQQSKLVIVPSLVWETFGLAALEAFAYGKPVLAHRVGGLPEIVQHNNTGRLYNTDTELYRELVDLLSNTNTLLTLGKNARIAAEQYYTPESHYTQIMDVYHRFLSASTPK